MIKASALLAALAIGLLVAGVLASSLLMVYVSIGVCAVAALILAVGILTHWSEIFGGGESRPASVPESWSAPQVQVSTPVLASAQASGTQVTGSPAAGTAGREDRRLPREDAGDRPPAPPVDVGRAPAEVPVAGSGDDLWERVDEELGSAGKRDTGALSWPGIELPLPPEPPGSSGKAVPPETVGPQAAPPAGAKAWVWGPGVGWQPSAAPDPTAWPPPAAAFAGPLAPPKTATPDTATPDTGSPDTGSPEPASPDADRADADRADANRPGPDTPDSGSPGSADAGPTAEEAAEPGPDAAAAGPAQDADKSSPGLTDDGAAPGSPEDGAAGSALEEGAAGSDPEDGAAGSDPEDETGQPDSGPDRPQWIISLPGHESPPADLPTQAVETQTPAIAGKDAAVAAPAAQETPAEEPEAQPSTGRVEEPEAEEPEAQPSTGRVEVTVVPGVARYHRRGCILIRFLGADDLEIMTRQEAEEVKFMACRACQPDQLEG